MRKYEANSLMSRIDPLMFNVFFITLLLVSSTIFTSCTGNNDNNNDNEMVLELNAIVTEMGYSLRIRNANDFAWVNVVLRINYNEYSYGYYYQIDSILRDEVRIPELFDFKNKEGKRFPYREQELEILTINAYTLDGKKGSYTLEWN